MLKDSTLRAHQEVSMPVPGPKPKLFHHKWLKSHESSRFRPASAAESRNRCRGGCVRSFEQFQAYAAAAGMDASASSTAPIRQPRATVYSASPLTWTECSAIGHEARLQACSQRCCSEFRN